MEFNLLECPHCRSTKFYVKNNKNEMVFFSIKEDMEIVSKPEYADKIKDIDISVIFCTGCSWEGQITQLLKQQL